MNPFWKKKETVALPPVSPGAIIKPLEKEERGYCIGNMFRLGDKVRAATAHNKVKPLKFPLHKRNIFTGMPKQLRF